MKRKKLLRSHPISEEPTIHPSLLDLLRERLIAASIQKRKEAGLGTFSDLDDYLEKLRSIGRMGRIEGWFALKEYKAQMNHQIKVAELACQAMEAQRRMYP